MLWEVLTKLMTIEELNTFRLVGGTSLSLLFGHRISVDIDLFTDTEYNTIDFDAIDKIFSDSFNYVEIVIGGDNSIGRSYYIGSNENNIIKTDLFCTDTFVFPVIEMNGLRLVRTEEIIAQGGRKKDFWDMHELMEKFSWNDMLDIYQKRCPYNYSREEIITKLTDFTEADFDFDPHCLKNKYWELTKLDIEESITKSFPK